MRADGPFWDFRKWMLALSDTLVVPVVNPVPQKTCTETGCPRVASSVRLTSLPASCQTPSAASYALTAGSSTPTKGSWMESEKPARYVRPGWFTTHIFNRLVSGLTRLGVSVWGSRELRVRGRRTAA